MLTVTGPRSGRTIAVMNNGPMANPGCGSDARNTCAITGDGTKRPRTATISSAITGGADDGPSALSRDGQRAATGIGAAPAHARLVDEHGVDRAGPPFPVGPEGDVVTDGGERIARLARDAALDLELAGR